MLCLPRPLSINCIDSSTLQQQRCFVPQEQEVSLPPWLIHVPLIKTKCKRPSFLSFPARKTEWGGFYSHRYLLEGKEGRFKLREEVQVKLKLVVRDGDSKGLPLIGWAPFRTSFPRVSPIMSFCLNWIGMSFTTELYDLRYRDLTVSERTLLIGVGKNSIGSAGVLC